MILVLPPFLWVNPGTGEEAREDSVRREEALAATLTKAPRAVTEQTADVVRWMARRRQFSINGVPYGFTGLPIVYFSPNTGWNYGGRLQWADYRRRPYRYKMTLYTLRSEEGDARFYYRIKVPRISGTGFGVQLLASFRNDIRTRYYGLGNESRFNQRYLDRDHPDFRDENYYHYNLAAPRFIFNILRHLGGPVSMSIGVGIERTKVSKRGRRSFYVEEGTPDGVEDGFTSFGSLTFNWDTRDEDAIAHKGVFHEWSYENSRNSLLALIFEEIDFRRYTFTDARYFQLSRRLNLAHRSVFEVLSGSVPLYAYGEVGGSRRKKGLGGSDSLRGFDRQRFTDDVRFFSNTELRCQLFSTKAFKQYFEWHGVSFLDLGRVWPDLDRLTPRRMHRTVGMGLRVYWNSDFVIRADLGFSAEQVYLGLKYRNIF